jgi:hypothetical protein
VRRPVTGPRLRLFSLAAFGLALSASSARADETWPARPKFQVALGLGASFRNDPNLHPDRPMSAFFFAAGLGDGAVGLDLRAFANGATFTQVTRLAVELVAVLRPMEPTMRGRSGYLVRVLRAASLDIGPSVERVSLGPASARRYGLMFGAHLDFPVAPEGVSKELRLRLGVRRLRAGETTLGDIPVNDSALELYGQLAFVF